MPKPERVLLFPLWRDLWARLEGVPDLLALAENALARRVRGNRRIVRPEPFNPSDEWLAAVVCHWATRCRACRIRSRAAIRVVSLLVNRAYAASLQFVKDVRRLMNHEVPKPVI